MIRKAKESDLSAIYSISQQSFDTAWSVASYEAEFFKNHSHSYVYILDNKIVAFLTVWVIMSEGEIVNIAVLKGRRKRGVASELLRYVFDKYSDVKKWNLEVDKKNTSAYNLYRKHNFFQTRIISNYYGQGKDAVQMSRGDLNA